ncbi:MAG TPA: DNA repair protein RecN [Firmicutes bacterium]|nr:DNA repair protein RecN [Bacillota bacterium]
MLLYLNLQNFALIDNLSLDFFPGFNVLTGETGAGKSIIVGALGLILGERASAEQVRTGSEQAFIEAVFSPPRGYPAFEMMMAENGLPLDEEIIISREISLSGRNLCRINGKVVPLVTLKNLGSFLVDMHGQHSHQSLLKTEQHLFLLDDFGDAEHARQIILYREVFSRWKKALGKLSSLGKNTDERAKQQELLKYQYEEIMAASLSEEEEKSLGRRLAILDNLEKILLTVHKAYTDIYSGSNGNLSIIDRLNMLIDEFSPLQKIDPRLENYVNLLSGVSATLSELGHDLYDYQGSLSYSPEERGDIENRLEVYYRLKRKYRAAVKEILSLAEDCREQMETLKDSEEEALSLEKECSELALQVKEAAGRLYELRKATALRLTAGVESVLGDLGIEGGIFSVSFQALQTPSATGAEEVEFLFSANPGEDPKPLAKIISAGEMARVMLALKSILAEQDRISTLVFDEIDSGIGGKTIQQVAQKMAELGRKHQIICVTHSPHLAGRADHQYHLFKEVRKGRSTTKAKRLQGEERLLEIARMLDGSGSEITKKHAAELLKRKTIGDD